MILIETYSSYSEEIQSKYMTIDEIAESKYGKIPSERFRDSFFSSVSHLPKGMINTIKASYPDESSRPRRLYSRDDINNFFNLYIHKYQLFDQLQQSVAISTVRAHYKKFNFNELVLGGSSDVFITKQDSEKLIKFCNSVINKADQNSIHIYKEIFGYLNVNEVGEMLYLSVFNVKRLVDMKILKVVDKFNGAKFFQAEQVIQLQTYQSRLKDELSENYYTSFQIQEKYGLAFSKYIKGSEEKVREPIQKIDPPILLCGYLGPQVKKLYNKSDVDDSWSHHMTYTALNSTTQDNPFSNFVDKVEKILKVSFSNQQENSKNLWYQYVEKFLLESRLHDSKRMEYVINQFAKNTKIIFGIFKKEIYQYSSDEINVLYLSSNSGINRTYQRDFYLFLKQVRNSFQINELPNPYDLNEINDPFEYERIKENDTGTYTIEQYLSLYEYANQVDYHKAKAITDTKKLINHSGKYQYQHYASCWLYILVLLTNNWRHSTAVTQIPRINLVDTKIVDLDWLENNTVTIEDANQIIYQIGRYITKINKNNVNAEGLFSIGEPLKIAFATAISICEFQTRELMDNSDRLIDLSGPLVPKYNPHKVFFKNFTEGFVLENRKLNRTLTTLIWSVMRHFGKGGLKEAQVSRSHLSDRTTINHYIKLSDDQVNKLVIDLFERNQFGFVAQQLNKILNGIESNRSDETQNIIYLNENFGDVLKIEATAGLINKLSLEKAEVIAYLKDFDLEALRRIQSEFIVGVLPSNQKYYQCIYAKCKFENEYGERPQCEACTFSIVNIYALSNIMDAYVSLMERILLEFDDATEGEKNRLANHFYLLNKLVEQARNEFGREVVDGFVDGKTERLKQIGEKLSVKKLKRYITTM